MSNSKTALILLGAVAVLFASLGMTLTVYSLDNDTDESTPTIGEY